MLFWIALSSRVSSSVAAKMGGRMFSLDTAAADTLVLYKKSFFRPLGMHDSFALRSLWLKDGPGAGPFCLPPSHPCHSCWPLISDPPFRLALAWSAPPSTTTLVGARSSKSSSPPMWVALALHLPTQLTTIEGGPGLETFFSSFCYLPYSSSSSLAAPPRWIQSESDREKAGEKGGSREIFESRNNLFIVVTIVTKVRPRSKRYLVM